MYLPDTVLNAYRPLLSYSADILMKGKEEEKRRRRGGGEASIGKRTKGRGRRGYQE